MIVHQKKKKTYKFKVMMKTVKGEAPYENSLNEEQKALPSA